MALIRVGTTWVGSTGSPYYTESYFLGAGDAAHASDAISAIYALLLAVEAHIDNALSMNISGDVDVVDVSTGQITSVLSVTGAPRVGTGTGDALPTLIQGLARFGTGTYINGRQVRGRMFFPGMLESNNTVTGEPAAGMNGVFNAALATYIADSCDPAVYSRTHSHASSIQTAVMSPQWSYLRSRRD